MSITWPWLFGILGTYLIIKVNDDFSTSLVGEGDSDASLALLLIFFWPLVLIFWIYHMVMSASNKKAKREFEFEWEGDVQPKTQQESRAKKTQTHYDNLKVSRDASPDEIRIAFKSLAQKYHPDKNQGNENAARVMLLVNKAYQVLSDPIEREKHDDWILRAETNSKAAQPNSTPSDPPAPQPQPKCAGQSANSDESPLVITLIVVAVIIAFGFLVEVANPPSHPVSEHVFSPPAIPEGSIAAFADSPAPSPAQPLPQRASQTPPAPHPNVSKHQHTYTNADLPKPRPSCEYKAVMSDDDLRACGINPSK